MKRICTAIGGLIVVLIPFLSPLKAQTQQEHLQLDVATARALEFNAQLKQHTLDAEIAKAQSAEANAAFLPQVEVSYNAMVTDNPLNAFGFKLNQRIVTQADFAPDLLNDPGASHDYSAQIKLMQPLLNVDAMYMRLAAKSAADAKRLGAKRMGEYTRFQIAQQYLQLGLAYKNVGVMRRAAKAADAFLERARGMREEGLILQSDLLQAKAYSLQMHTQVTTAEAGVHNASDQLAILMGETPVEGKVYVVDSIAWDIPVDVNEASVMGRTDILAYQAGVQAAKNQVRASKLAYLPRINAFGTYQLNDNEAFGFSQNSYLLGVNMTWTLFKGSQNYHKIRGARFQVKKLQSQLLEQKNKAQAEYFHVKRQLDVVKQEIKKTRVMAAQTAEAYRILQDRYAEGLSPTSDLLRVQAQQAQQELMLEQALFKKNVTIAMLRLVTAQ